MSLGELWHRMPPQLRVLLIIGIGTAVASLGIILWAAVTVIMSL